MPEIIQDWLGTRLGVLIDMTPEKFGRNVKDGKLLAQLLYNYGVIPAHILNNVKESKNYYECYNNLVVLKPWLKYIGVTHDDSTLREMACGEGSAAISLFYSVYLNLERKDRFHYLSKQKERRITDDGCQKFKVDWVPESFVSGGSGDSSSKLVEPLLEKTDMIEWHKAKCGLIVEQIKKVKARFHKIVKKKPELGPLVSKHATSQPLDKRQIEAEETRNDITAFERKHPYESHNLNFLELTEQRNVTETQPCFVPSMTEAKNIISNIKRRKRGDVYARNFQQKMQHMLLDEQWKEIVEKQDGAFESEVCNNLLRQSQYEKQMTKKLYLMRNRKKVCAENRKKIECLKIDQQQKEYDETVQKNMEMKGEYWEAEEIERERIEELHRRLYDEKARTRRQMLKVECRKICEAWAEIAVRISEFRDLIGCQIPKALMKDLKELFFKDLPIFDLLDHFEDIYDQNARAVCRFGEEEGETDYQNGEFERLKSEEVDRQSVLDECDFNDYLYLMGSWMVELLFPGGTETEVKHLVLGYIVHKLLSVKYPPPNARVAASIKTMKPTSVVVGLTDEAATEMLIDLMEARGILVVRVDDAINFVLAAYKEELSVVRDVDITFQKITEDTLKRKNSESKEKEIGKKLQLLKAEASEFLLSEDDFTMIDKETQTPRKIPEDDPLLSPNAELGKLVFEALGGGDPVPDPVIVSAVVAYVVSKQNDYDGWLLLNYPLLYSQASELEYSLLGYRALPVIDGMETLEETEGFSYRGPWGSAFSRDAFAERRVSKLVPQPEIFNVTKAEQPKTYFDLFIKLRKAPETPYPRRSDESDELGPVEKHYLDLQTFCDFEYQNLNFQTLKNLGKVILGVSTADDVTEFDLPGKNSVEIFGSVVLELNEKWEPKRKAAKELGGGQKKVANEMKLPSDVEEELGREEQIGEEEEEDEEEAVMDTTLSSPQPGDPTWEWATGSQPEGFLLALASLWENMEAVYVEDFKNVFFTLRVHRSNVVNYCWFVRKSLRILMRRPDEKQKVLSDFQQMFNDIDEDLRPDVDVKCELHVRVSEVEQVLMSFADERKKDSLKDTTRFAEDGWVPDEMANLVNTFLSAFQLEADRCIDSCQIIMDYYTSLQQKIPEAKPIPKVPVPRLQSQDRKYSVLSSGKPGSPRNSDSKRKSLSEQKISKTRSLADRRKRSSEASLAGAGEFVTDILTRLALPEDGLTPFHTFFTETVQALANEVKTTVEGCIHDARKSDKGDPSPTRQTKNSKKPSETYIPPANENLLAEWTTALEDEVSRFAFRSQLILARGIFDMNELLTMILNILSSLTEEITDMYFKEIDSIAECCRVFRCGIEEEIPIRPLLELKEDEFLVHMDDVPPSEEDLMTSSAQDEERRFRFTIDQLSLLFWKLQRVAPDGEIIKRSLVYIFEDLRMLNPEVENCTCFPEVWNDIEPDDVAVILDEVYKNLEIVHWKDFIVYALDIPLPTELDILSMRKMFRHFDSNVTELISRENYNGISLWFENFATDEQIEKSAKVKDLLYNMYRVNELQMNYSALLLAFCKDENPVLGFEKALALAMGKMIEKLQESLEESVMGESPIYDYGMFGETDRKRSQPFCCPSPTDFITPKCIHKEEIVRCQCKYEPESIPDDNTEELNYGHNEGEGGRFFFYGLQQSGASSIPLNILSSLLKASFPSLPQLSVLLDCQQTFQDTLNAVYDSLDPCDNAVDVHKLIKHQFINRLLHSTNKFKFVKLKPILLSVAKNRSPTSRAVCSTAKPKFSCCLRK